MRLRDKLDRLLDERRLRQSDVAAACGIAYSTFRSYLEDDTPRIPGVDTAIRIARFFGVSADWLWDDAREWPERAPIPALSVGEAELLEELQRRRELVQKDMRLIASRLGLDDPAKRESAESLAERAYHHYKTMPFAEQQQFYDLAQDLHRYVLLEDQFQLLSLNPGGTSTTTTEVLPTSEADSARELVTHHTLPLKVETLLRDHPALLRVAFHLQEASIMFGRNERPGEIIPFFGGFGETITAARYERMTVFQQRKYVPVIEDPENGPPAEKPLSISRGYRVPERFKTFVRYNAESPRSFAYQADADNLEPAIPAGSIVICEPAEPDRTGARACLVVYGPARMEGLFFVKGNQLTSALAKRHAPIRLKPSDKPEFYPVIAGPFPAPSSESQGEPSN